jgi:3-phosphoshikimate 1-carboxyvinyltransferase
MKLIIHPGHPLRGETTVPGDKSLSHRAALFASLAEGESTVNRFLVSGVTRAMLDALTALGIAWQLKDERLTVQGRGLRGWRDPSGVLDCRNSATTIRLLTGAAAAAGIEAVLDGSAGLRRRPMDRIVLPLRQMGVKIETTANGCAPLRLARLPAGAHLRSATLALPVASAQVKSCLLLAALSADGPVTVTEPGPSRDHTERMLSAMGVRVETVVNKRAAKEAAKSDAPFQSVTIHPPTAPLKPLVMTLPGDISAAAFLIVAALITPGSEITIRDVGLNPTRTGLIDALRSMGASIHIFNERMESGEPVADLAVHHSPLHGTTVSGDLVVRMIDEFPAFAVAAAYATGVTDVRDAAELRTKESDRIAGLANELGGLGVAIEPRADGFRITGGSVAGGTATARGDHRIAMSCALAGLASRAPVAVNDAEIMAESFPAFRETLAKLGAKAEFE